MGATSHFPLLFGLASPHSSQRCFSAFCLARRVDRHRGDCLRGTGSCRGSKMRDGRGLGGSTLLG